MEGDEPYLDTAVHHCQQAAEKALKAFLTHHGTVFDWTHDLTELLDLCIPLEATFEAWRDAAGELTPYAVRFRYAADLLEPEPTEAKHALERAEALTQHILSLLPTEIRTNEQ
jgi:HEPN domain-containing protein